MARSYKKQVWTNIDAYGLLNGIGTWDEQYRELKYIRIPDETNLELRKKIVSMHQHPVNNITIQDVVNGISNELLYDAYNVNRVNSFVLSRSPEPSGNIGEQDIWVYYQPPGDSTWTEVSPQWWASGVYTDRENRVVQTSGFIVWQNEFYRDSTGNRKTHKYSRLLRILDENIPDKSKLKIKYHVRLYDKDGDSDLFLFTDMDHVKDSRTEQYTVRTPHPVTTGFLTDHVVAYRLDEIPSGIKEVYFDASGYATDMTYKIRDIVDKNYRHKWKDVRNRNSIWDAHRDFGYGHIPSFYDAPFKISQGEEFSNEEYLDGGIEHLDPSIYMKEVRIVMEGDTERWYPVLQPGTFYMYGVPYTLMENPKYSGICLGTGQATLPSGIERWHHTILADDGYFDSDDLAGFIFEDYVYPINWYTDSILSPSGTFSNAIHRKRPYLSNDMGIEISLKDGEYAIDYDNYTIYSSGITNAVLVWDDTIIPSGKVCNDELADLNPLNDVNLEFERYFLYFGGS